MAESSNGVSSKLDKFDGTDPGLYKRWRRRAMIMLMSLPTTYPTETHGPKLMEFLGGEAEQACEHIPIEDLGKDGGHMAILKALDERYKPLEKDDLSEALREYFYDVTIKQGELLKNFVTRFTTAHRKLEEQGVKLPEEVQGWFLVRKMRLDASQEAMLLTSTQGSYKYSKICGGVKAIFSNTRGVVRSKNTFAAESVGDTSDTATVLSSPSDDDDSYDQAALEAAVEMIQEQEGYDDEAVLETFETYQQIRKRVQETKKTRGYRSSSSAASWGSGRRSGPVNLRGSIVARIDQAKARTKCHICDEVGHWKRECPRRTAGGSNAKKPGGNKEVMIVEEDENYDEQDLEDLFQRMNVAGGTAQTETLVTEPISVKEYRKGALSQLSIESPRSDADLDCPTVAMASEVFHEFLYESFAADQDDLESCGDYVAQLDRHGVPDTACRRSLIGAHVLHDLEEVLRGKGKKVTRRKCMSSFKFGNAGELTSREVAQIPCSIGNRQVVLQVAVLPTPGERTPLLMSKEMLKALGAHIDMEHDCMTFAKLGVTVQMGETSKGHYAIPLFDGFDGVVYRNDAKMDDGTDEVLSSEQHHNRQHAAAQGDQDQAGSLSNQDDAVQQRTLSNESGDTATCPGAGTEVVHDRSGCEDQCGSVPRCGRGLPSSRPDGRKHCDDGRQVQEPTSHDAQHLHGRQGLCGVGTQSHQHEVSTAHAHPQGVHRDERQDEGSESGSRGEVFAAHGIPCANADAAVASTSDRGRDTSQHRQLVPMERTAMSDLVHTQESGTTTRSKARRRSRRDGGGHHDSDPSPADGCGELGTLHTDDHPDEPREPRCDLLPHSELGGASARSGSIHDDRDDDASDTQVEEGVPDITPGEVKPMNRRVRRTLRQTIEHLLTMPQDTPSQREKAAEVLLSSTCEDSVHGCGMHDISEVFSVPRVVTCAKKKGMFPGSSYDLLLGDDMLQAKHRKRILDELKRDRPLCVVVSPPCTMFSRRRRPGDPEVDKQEMIKALVLLNFGIQVCKLQMSLGRYFVFEHPLGADSWHCRNLVELVGDPRVQSIGVDMCAYNLCDHVNGLPHKKPTRIACNFDEDIGHSLEKKCDGSHEHQRLEGSVKTEDGWVNRTKLAQKYTEEFCNAICDAVRKQKRRVLGEKRDVFVHEGLAQEEGSRKMAALKVHDNLGHPSSERLCMVLKSAGASDKAISVAKGLKCQTCEQNKSPTLQKVAKVRRTYDFNVGVACDTFEIDVGEKGNLHFLSVICEGTNFHQVFPLWQGKSANETRRAYRRGWKAVYGSPVRCFCDNGGEFEKEFQEGLEMDGTVDERSASESPWQNGLCEKHGGVWKNMFKKCFETVNPSSRDEIEEIVEQVNLAKNSLVRKDGFSPLQRVFGKEPRIPGLLYSGDDHVPMNSAILAGDRQFCRAMEIRQAARTAFLNADNDERVRRTLERRSRPERGPFPPGSKVYVWRRGGNVRKSGRQSMFWRGPGTVIGSSDNCTKFWVSLGTKVLKCSPEQLRRLLPEQEAQVKLVPKELVDWNKQLSKRGVATFHDISADPKPDTNGQVVDYWEVSGNTVRRVHAVPRTQLYVPNEADNPPVALEDLQDTRTSHVVRLDGTKETLNDNWRSDDLEAALEVELYDMAQRTGDTEFVLKKRAREEGTEVDDRNIRARTEFQESQQPGAESDVNFPEPVEADIDQILDSDLEVDSTVTPGDTNEPPEGNGNEQTMQQDGETNQEAPQNAESGSYGPIRATPLVRAMRRNLNLLDQGAPPRPTYSQDVLVVGEEDKVREQLYDRHQMYIGNGWRIDWQNKTILKMHSDRDCKFTPRERQCPIPLDWLTGARITAARFKDEPDKVHFLSDDFQITDKPHQKLRGTWTGFTVFAFDMPLHHDMGEDEKYEVNEVDMKTAVQYSDIDQGKLTELEKLLKYEAIEIVPRKEAEKIRRDPVKGKRILPSRFVITKKPDEKTGQVKTKCRWCIRGYLDPDLTELSTQSPTVSQEALMASLQVCASNQWEIQIADIEGAFLQGDKLHREQGELHVETPPDGFPDMEKGVLLRVVKAVYGLGDAPRQWFKKIVDALLKLNMTQSQLDACSFQYWKNGVLQGILCLHVDDMLTAGTKCFHEDVLEQLKKVFPFKHWKHSEGEFLGRRLQQKTDGSITISQREYSEKLVTNEISRERRREKHEKLTEKEVSKLRGITGSMNWLVGATRPDLAAANAILQQRTSKATVQELIDANKLIGEARDHAHVSVTVRPIPLENIALLMTADASWGTDEDLSSQGAYMICATEKKIKQGGVTGVTPLKWKSYKQERQVNSTLAAELLSVSKGIGETMWMRYFFLEMMNSDFSLSKAHSLQKQIDVVAVTDNKPPYDFANSDTSVGQDKRLMIELLLMRRDLKMNSVTLRWIDTKQMLVDCLTKVRVKPHLLRYVMYTGEYAIMEEKKMLEAKAAARALKQHRQDQYNNENT